MKRYLARLGILVATYLVVAFAAVPFFGDQGLDILGKVEAVVFIAAYFYWAAPALERRV